MGCKKEREKGEKSQENFLFHYVLSKINSNQSSSILMYFTRVRVKILTPKMCVKQ